MGGARRFAGAVHKHALGAGVGHQAVAEGRFTGGVGAPARPTCGRYASTSATSSPKGTPQERRSLYEALIDISDDTIVPVYRVPMTASP
jgi:hypothetical protein